MSENISSLDFPRDLAISRRSRSRLYAASIRRGTKNLMVDLTDLIETFFTVVADTAPPSEVITITLRGLSELRQRGTQSVAGRRPGCVHRPLYLNLAQSPSAHRNTPSRNSKSAVPCSVLCGPFLDAHRDCPRTSVIRPRSSQDHLGRRHAHNPV
jgi:hypothetical protein